MGHVRSRLVGRARSEVVTDPHVDDASSRLMARFVLHDSSEETVAACGLSHQALRAMVAPDV